MGINSDHWTTTPFADVDCDEPSSILRCTSISTASMRPLLAANPAGRDPDFDCRHPNYAATVRATTTMGSNPFRVIHGVSRVGRRHCGLRTDAILREGRTP